MRTIHDKFEWNNLVEVVDFKFFNISGDLMSEQELEEIDKYINIEGNDNLFWINEKLLTKKIAFLFEKVKFKEGWHRRSGTQVKDGEEKYVVSTINLTGYTDITVEEFMKVKYKYKNFFFSFDAKIYDDIIISLFDAKNPVTKFKVINNFEEFLIYAIDNNFIDHTNRTNKCFDIENITLQQICELIGSDYKVEYDAPTTRVKGGNRDLHIIKSVVEKRINNKNYRIYVGKRYDCYDYRKTIMGITSEDEIIYNLIDEGRMFMYANNLNKFVYLDLQSKEYTIDNSLVLRFDIYEEICRNARQLFTDEQILLNPNTYSFYKERFGTLVLAKKLVDEDKGTQVEQIKNAYVRLLKIGKDVKINSIIFNKKYIRMLDQNFNLEFDEGFIEYDGYLVGELRSMALSSNITYNFNELFSKLLSESELRPIFNGNYSTSIYKNMKNCRFKVNGMEIVFSKEESRIHINGIFVRVDDLKEVLEKAICYNNVEDYDAYLKDVSFIGCDWKSMINTGILLKVKNPFYEIYKSIDKKAFSNNDLLRFSFVWNIKNRSKISLVLNKKRYEIRLKYKFKTAFNHPDRIVSVSQLKKELCEALSDLNDKEVLEIVRNGIEEAKIVKARGEELVNATLKDTNSIIGNINLQGAEIGGVFVNGIKGGKYFIKDISLDVYKWKDGQWNRRCVVDIASKNRIYEDRFANRVMNIYNEFDKITTIQG